MPEEKKKKINYSSAWQEAKKLLWKSRWRLALGAVLMLVSRLCGLVLPASTKFLIDDVLGKSRFELLKWIALAVAASTLIQAVTTFILSQILGVAAQLAITDMRKGIQEKIERLPISYFD
ncbi:MAG: ABC transporter transmembrane domain-containing protein, partial [Pyrinomonadaceae bacterium]